MATYKNVNNTHTKGNPLNQFKDTSLTVAHDFKEFLTRSHAIDLASAIVMGGSVTSVINSIVNDLILPCIGALIGTNIKSLVLDVGPVRIAYGSCIQAILNFVLVAWVLFVIIRSVAKFRKKLDEIDPKSGRSK